MMLIIGLTGSIAMGKSETANILRRLGIPVIDSDAIVHELFASGGGLVGPIERAFPGVTSSQGVDRVKLSQQVMGNPQAFRTLESLTHPAVRRVQRQHMSTIAHARGKMVALDIPLLFETGAEKRVDAVLVVSAPAKLQWRRAMARPGMSAEKLTAILSKQMPDHEKRKRADAVIHSGLGKRRALRDIRKSIRKLTMMKGGRRKASAWQPGYR